MRNRKLKVLLAASEATPWAKTGGLADVVGSLARIYANTGLETVLFLPLYGTIHRHHRLVPTAIRFSIPLGARAEEGRLWRAVSTKPGLEVYLIDHPGFFHRDDLYGTGGIDFPDNVSRFTFFSRSVLTAARRLGFDPDIVHIHDWQTALIPLYLRTLYREHFPHAASVYTIHNLGYQGLFWHYDMPILGLGWDLFHMDGLEFHGKINFMKGGIVFADAVTTVSPNYAREIRTPEYGFGLDGVLRQRAADLTGIVNGIDTTLWNPATDPAIERWYSHRKPGGKKACRRALQKSLGLDPAHRGPLLGVVSRLSVQKGIDLILSARKALLERRNVQLAILGTGDPETETAVTSMMKRYPGRCAVRIGFDEPLAHALYAGCDLLLMPSRYEPCGLSQLIAMRYGTIPVVRKTGGLADTVRERGAASNGFVFSGSTAPALLRAVDRALHSFEDAVAWHGLQQRAMTTDVSWERSATAYGALYGRLIEG